MSLTVPPAPSSFVAIATTAHLMLALWQWHKRPTHVAFQAIAALSFMFAVSPWIMPSFAGVALGLAAHGAWFGAWALAMRWRGHRSPQRRADTGPRHGFVLLPVLEAVHEASDVKRFRLARPEGFEFSAGQFLTVRVRIDGCEHVRCYSISSSPQTREHIEITVKRQGRVSGALHATVDRGALLAVKPPAGAFVYPRERAPLVLIAGGIGITPVLSMLRHAIAADPARQVTLLYSAKTQDGLAYRNELAAMAERHGHVRVVFTVTQGPAAMDVRHGRIDESLLRVAVPHLASSVVCLCGPAPMIDGLRDLLPRLGVPPANVRSEVFELAAAARGGHAFDHSSDETAKPHRMKVASTGEAIEVAPHQTLLEAAEACGVGIDSICRAGVCGTCRTRVTEGRVACDSALLDDDDRREGYVLACVSRPLTDFTVDVR